MASGVAVVSLYVQTRLSLYWRSMEIVFGPATTKAGVIRGALEPGPNVILTAVSSTFKKLNTELPVCRVANKSGKERANKSGKFSLKMRDLERR